MRTDDLDYALPTDRIACRPAQPRDAARLMVLRGDHPPEHRTIADLPGLLECGDAMVFNTTAVIPARIVAQRGSGGVVEGLALGAAATVADAGEPSTIPWRLLLRGSARLREGEQLLLQNPGAADANEPVAALRLVRRDGEAWLAHFESRTADGWEAADALDVLLRCGRTPLPPYILGARRTSGELAADAEDRGWYETVFADASRRASVAAPTAGLHFTPRLLEALERQGVRRIDVTLHVGEGTFRPVTAPTLAEHAMHSERFEVLASSLSALREQRSGMHGASPRGRIIAVGSTAARTLESLPDGALDPDGPEAADIRGETDLLIVPPYRFRHVDGMLTNFHLPRSTLLAMVAAMVGLDRLKAAYAEAIDHGYRFFSYGDAMLILPDGLSSQRPQP